MFVIDTLVILSIPSCKNEEVISTLALSLSLFLPLFLLRDIASAIKEVLDAVNELSQNHQDLPKMPEYKKVSVHRKGTAQSPPLSLSFKDT